MINWTCEKCGTTWEFRLGAIGVYGSTTMDYEFSCPKQDGGIKRESPKIIRYRPKGQATWIEMT